VVVSLRIAERRAIARHRLRGRPLGRDPARRRWLVLVPHPDDETLGAGQLICALADAGRPPQVVYLTDGAASHPGSPSWSSRRLAARRRREAHAALCDLMGRGSPPPLFLDWPDAKPWREGEDAFERAARRLVGVMRRGRLSAIATTWTHEPHCDHAAAAALARNAARRTRPRPDLYGYLVWGWDKQEAAQLASARAVVLAPQPRHRRARRRALTRHRSQLGAVITDSPKGFRLPPSMAHTIPGVQLLFGPERP
jgi:LmbE family N-acetylglucosaminyl deacetylase